MCSQPICMQGSSEIRHREHSCSWRAALGLWEDCSPEVPQDRGLGPPPPHPLTPTCQVGLLGVLIVPIYWSGFTIVPRETESITMFPLCASLLNTYYCMVLQVQGRTKLGGGLCSLGGCSPVSHDTKKYNDNSHNPRKEEKLEGLGV